MSAIWVLFYALDAAPSIAVLMLVPLNKAMTPAHVPPLKQTTQVQVFGHFLSTPPLASCYLN